MDISSLRTITGQVDVKLTIFTEDAFSAQWVESILRTNLAIPMNVIAVHGMAGDGLAVGAVKHHNQNPTIKFPEICFLDGDSEQKNSDSDEIYQLPGGRPELFVYDKVLDKIEECAGQLAVALHSSCSRHKEIARIINDVRRANRDLHVLFCKLA